MVNGVDIEVSYLALSSASEVVGDGELGFEEINWPGAVRGACMTGKDRVEY